MQLLHSSALLNTSRSVGFTLHAYHRRRVCNVTFLLHHLLCMVRPTSLCMYISCMLCSVLAVHALYALTAVMRSLRSRRTVVTVRGLVLSFCLLLSLGLGLRLFVFLVFWFLNVGVIKSTPLPCCLLGSSGTPTWVILQFQIVCLGDGFSPLDLQPLLWPK